MAVACFDDNIIASSNLKDIASYCSKKNIKYLTTMVIILEGFEKGKITKAEADTMIKAIRKKLIDTSRLLKRPY